MLDNAINEFFSERQAGWLKPRLKADMSNEEKARLEQECADKFSLAHWLPDAAKRAGQLSMVSHPGKFSHPSAKISCFVAQAERRVDGLLRTGNVTADPDVLGNAAAMDVFKFLSLMLADDRTVLVHLATDSDTIREQLSCHVTSFDDVREGLLAIKEPATSLTTSERVKQVYFPCDTGYHLLSVLTPSGLVFEMKRRINHQRFSEEAKSARAARRDRQLNNTGFDDLPKLTVIGYGGTKPQNISVLNSQNGGRAYLLPCLPPTLRKRDVRLPKRNFFGDTIYPRYVADSLFAFHRILKLTRNNYEIRNRRDDRIQEYIDQIIDQAWAVRMSEPAGWSTGDTYAALPAYQKIWLDEAHTKEREGGDDWLDHVINEMTHWFFIAYEKLLGKDRVSLGNGEFIYVKQKVEQEIREELAKNREALR